MNRATAAWASFMIALAWLLGYVSRTIGLPSWYGSE